jgi:outer membrane protein OmpA-like peptidoglycan-associated protein
MLKGLETMTIRGKAFSFVALGMAVGLAGCSTLTAGRDRVVKAPPRCADQTAQIYFEQFSAEVTKEGRAVLAAAAAQSKPCKVTSVDILGLADNVGGTPDSNLDLSKRRAQAVTAALASVGLPAGEFKITAAGEAGSTTADGRSKPLRRRADIVVHLSPS